jgi:hypothetical protein
MTPKQFYDWQTAGGTDDVMRVASLEDTLKGKIKAWKDTAKRQSKKLKDLGDIARLVENHPRLWELLDTDLQEIIQEQ